ncbi:MATE family efflux transporter [Oceaniradius stylonematis]|uniref:MATE family efflux transporter n=1 Tax=Oceaniradius stylonematis TaxID=2184161 RepID=UPI00273F3762|nr:MATE family efflux transporter [Oceaniradius stylonematis]
MSTASHSLGSAPAPMSWSAHARATLALGVPLVGSQLGGMAMNTTDTVMLGWYGVTELAAGSIATQLLFTIMMFGAGFAYAVLPMAAAAEGQGDQRQVRRSVRMGLWVGALYCLAVMPVLWFIEPIMLALGQDTAVAELSRVYMRIAQWSIFPLLLWWTLRGFLTVIERTRIVFWATMAGVVLNALLNWAFIFGNWGAPELGMRGAAIATLGTNLLVFGLLVAYAALNERARPYELFVRFWRPDWPAFGEVFRIGLPIGTMITAETGLFIFSSIFMGWISVVALAAHGIALQLASLAFMVPMGMAQAATARVGHYHGRGDALGLDRAAKTVMAMCLAFAATSALLFFTIPETLIALFLDQSNPDTAAVLAYAVPLLFVGACFQLVDSAQAIAAALLRGLRDTRVPMIIAVFAYWPVGLFLGWLLAFPLGFGGVGVWVGMALGLLVAAILLSHRFFALRPNIGL